MTLGPSHKLDGEEEISLGRPKLLIEEFNSCSFYSLKIIFKIEFVGT
jgi:hypothetical protein